MILRRGVIFGLFWSSITSAGLRMACQRVPTVERTIWGGLATHRDVRLEGGDTGCRSNVVKNAFEIPLGQFDM